MASLQTKGGGKCSSCLHIWESRQRTQSVLSEAAWRVLARADLGGPQNLLLVSVQVLLARGKNCCLAKMLSRHLLCNQLGDSRGAKKVPQDALGLALGLSCSETCGLLATKPDYLARDPSLTPVS